jgi:SAM-dependent methyltransferase
VSEVQVQEYTERKFNILRRELGSLNGLVLDIGCGKGISRRYMKDIRYVGIDIKFNNSQKKPENFIIASATNLPFIEECFDAILFLDIIEHINAPKDIEGLLENYRALKCNGKLIISTPNTSTILHGESFLKKDHVNCMSPKVLKNKFICSKLQIIKRIPGDIFIIPPHRWLLYIPLRIRRLLADIYSRLDKYQIYEVRKVPKTQL